MAKSRYSNYCNLRVSMIYQQINNFFSSSSYKLLFFHSFPITKKAGSSPHNGTKIETVATRKKYVTTKKV